MINAKVRQFNEYSHGYEYEEIIYKNIIRIFHDSDTDYNEITIVCRTQGVSEFERATFTTDNLQIEIFETED